MQIKLCIFNWELGGSQQQFAGLVSSPVLGRWKRPYLLYRLGVNQVRNLFGIGAQQVLLLAEAMNKSL